MKTLKLTMSILALFLITFIGCKKEKNEPEPENTAVTTEDLLDYQMYWVLEDPDGNSNLRLLYFTKEGNEVKATLDGIVSRNIITIKLENNVFKLDLQDNGSVVYTFELAKKNGEIALVSSKFYNVNNPAYKASAAALSMVSKFKSIKNNVFKHQTNDQIKTFGADSWRYSAFPNIAGTFYECGKGGWKGRINGIDYMGLCFYIDSNNMYMGVQKYGDKEIMDFFSY